MKNKIPIDIVETDQFLSVYYKGILIFHGRFGEEYQDYVYKKAELALRSFGIDLKMMF